MVYLRWLLLPFSLLYAAGVWLRNRLYDWGWLRQTGFAVPVIVVGNLEVGGTGKTPMTEYLIRLLSDRYRVATLSRGYGRKTSGYGKWRPAPQRTSAGTNPCNLSRNSQLSPWRWMKTGCGEPDVCRIRMMCYCLTMRSNTVP